MHIKHEGEQGMCKRVKLNCLDARESMHLHFTKMIFKNQAMLIFPELK